MRKLVKAFEAKSPLLNPLDVWVWEVMAKAEMLGGALAPTTVLVDTNETPGGGGSLNTHHEVAQAVGREQGGRLV